MPTQPIYITVCFNRDFKNQRLPEILTILMNGQYIHTSLYLKDSKKNIKDIKSDIEKIRNLILKVNDKKIPIITDCFRNLIDALALPLDIRIYNVYDMHLHSKSTSKEENEKVIEQLIDVKTKKYQKVLSNSSIVYADLENRGLLFNFSKVNPLWSQDTFSGRSKSTGFNIQGFSEVRFIHTISSIDTDILLHFDWICADIRVASIMSSDHNLAKSFKKSDPYTYLMNILNTERQKQGLTDRFTREECKIIMLKSINSLDHRSLVFLEAYPELGDWIRSVSDSDSCDSMLGRTFSVSEEKSRLSVFNGVMQGSVAHAMQNVIRQIWEKLGNKLVCDIHDSIVISCSPERVEIKAIIKLVSEIMLNPFNGLINGEHLFPVKVSVGKKWRSYKVYKSIYNYDDLEVL